MSTECKICEGTRNEPGELGCVWCDDTGKAGGLKPAPSDELAAFRAYMAANPMATYWSVWQERAKFSTAELQASHLREAALQELVTRADQLADDLQTKLVAENNLEAAAKKLASCMDYPWEHMPEQGRNSMREHAKAVICAALHPFIPSI